MLRRGISGDELDSFQQGLSQRRMSMNYSRRSVGFFRYDDSTAVQRYTHTHKFMTDLGIIFPEVSLISLFTHAHRYTHTFRPFRPPMNRCTEAAGRGR